jgi:epoxyqueuosine reductase
MGMTNKPQRDMARQLHAVINDFLQTSPENTLDGPFKEKAFEEALIGFAGGADPIYNQFKEYVGPFHWTPAEIFNLTFPHAPAKDDDLTVISYVLPQNPVTKADNRRETVYPAERWARGRIFGEEVNKKVRRLIVESLAGAGVDAVAPMLSEQWSRKDSVTYVYASTWSERHAAYASGLGTFGLCDGLITPKGKAMRVGSVVARIQIPVTPRPYDNHHAYCLFYTRGTCKKCIPRCPVGALSEAGHDKVKCRAHIRATTDYVKMHFGFDGYGCGLCQTGVPCESRIPVPGRDD